MPNSTTPMIDVSGQPNPAPVGWRAIGTIPRRLAWLPVVAAVVGSMGCGDDGPNTGSVTDSRPGGEAVNAPLPSSGRGTAVDRVEWALREEEQVEAESRELLKRLLEPQQNRELNELRVLSRVYGTGKFLRELKRIVSEQEADLELPGRFQQDLDGLLSRWEQLEQVITQIGTRPGDVQ